uniref:Uncharacterized protein n=1 Tax=Chaetoceros debilis TaxID=122233 RepID=A0A7S3V825_9STRA
MTVLQPITTKSPSNCDVLEQSGLPFSFVLRPFGNRNSLSSGNDDEFYARQLEKRRRNPPISDDSKGEGADIQHYPLKLALVAKCTHCGSPMNPSSPIVGRWTVLCNLCGQTYDIDYQTQHESRMAASASLSVTSFPSISMKSNTHTQNKSVTKQLDSSDMDETEYRNRYSRTSTLTECVKPLMEYSLPLLSMAPLSPTPNSMRIEDSTDMEIAENIYTLPAKLCPPLLAIFIDATCPNPQYYNRICEALNQLINLKDSSENESKSGEHVKDGYGLCKSTRIGIFCMTENGGLSIFDLTENGGHLKHVWVRKPDADTASGHYQSGDDDYDNEEFEVAPLADIMTPEEIFAPLDSEYSKSCVLSALRGLADSSITIDMACQRSHNSKKKLTSRTKVSSGHGHGGGVCFGSTLEYFLDFMKHVGYHPGEMNHNNHMLGENIDSGTCTSSCDLEPAQKFIYAGGKIMCFLSGPPDEIGVPTIRKSLKAESQAEQNGRIGAGGYGGSCAELGKRFESMKYGGSGGGGSYLSGNDEPADGDGDVEFGKGLPRKDISGKGSAEKPSHQDGKIAKTKYLNVTALYEDIGKYSARGAFSTEIFALLPKLENDESDTEHLPEQYVGIPFLRLLSDRSGGAGPLVLTYPLGPSTSDDEDDILANEVISRSPLNRNHAFGSLLRVRLPPSLRIDTNTARSKASKSNKMSVNSEHNFDECYQTNGMYGSITASNEDIALFYIGSCDESSTLSFALNICSRSGRLDEYVYVDGRGDVRLCPCIQTCFAYTSIVKNRGQWVTVRRLRVLTLELDLTVSVESMTASLDSEALIVVSSFHVT